VQAQVHQPVKQEPQASQQALLPFVRLMYSNVREVQKKKYGKVEKNPGK
jgi:hypothetical protein